MATQLMKKELTQILTTYNINLNDDNTEEIRAEWARFSNLVKELTYKNDWYKKDVIKAYKELRESMTGNNLGLRVHLVDSLEDLFNSKSKKLMKNLDTVVSELLASEDITPTTTLKTKHIGNALNEELKGLDLFNEKILIVAPTGTGKSTAVAGIDLGENSSMVIFKGELALIDNAKAELEKDMKAGIIPTKQILIFTGKERPTELLWYNKPNQIILATYNQIGRLDAKLTSKRCKIKWLYVIDENHKLVTNDYRTKVLAEMEYILRSKPGYIATTATHKNYCPLTYTRRIEIAKEDNILNSEVRIYTNKETDLEKVLVDTLALDKKIFCLYFENKTDNLIYLKEQMEKEGRKAEVINSEIYQDDVEMKGTVAYNIKRGRTGTECLLSTCLLLEGFSMNSEQYEEVHYFLKSNPGRELGHSLEIIQGAARLRGAKKIVIHIARPKKEIEESKQRYLTEELKIKAAQLKLDRVIANPEAYNSAEGLRNLLRIVTEQLKEDPTNKTLRTSHSHLKRVCQEDIIVLDIKREKSLGSVEWEIEDLEVISTPIMKACKNYEIDKEIERASDNLFRTRLSRAGHRTFTVVGDKLNYTEEEIKAKTEEKKAKADLIKQQMLKELMAVENLDDYFKEVFAGRTKVTKLMVKMIFNLYWLMRLGFTKDEGFKLLEDNSYSQIESLISQENLNIYLNFKYVKPDPGRTMDDVLKGNYVRGTANKELAIIEEMIEKIGIIAPNQTVREDDLIKKGLYGKLRSKLLKLYDLEDKRSRTRDNEKRVDLYTIKGWKVGIEETVVRSKITAEFLESFIQDFSVKRGIYEELPETIVEEKPTKKGFTVLPTGLSNGLEEDIEPRYTEDN